MNRSRILFAALFVCIAVAVNAATSRSVRPSEKLSLTSLPIGSTFAVPALTRVSGPAAVKKIGESCQVFVVVALNCPHCHLAAKRGKDVADRAAVTWVTPDTGASLGAFARELPSTDALVTSAEFHSRLKVRGVPAAVLLDSASRIRLVWPYDGTSSVAALTNACAGRNPLGA